MGAADPASRSSSAAGIVRPCCNSEATSTRLWDIALINTGGAGLRICSCRPTSLSLRSR